MRKKSGPGGGQSETGNVAHGRRHKKTGPVLFGGPVLPEKGEELPGNDHARPRVF